MEIPAQAHLKVALLQMVSEGAVIEANARKGEEFCRRAAARGADIALFPEMWSVGYAKYPPGDDRARAEWLKLAVLVMGLSWTDSGVSRANCESRLQSRISRQGLRCRATR